ncbi:hypothetical protein BDW22DRAFT_215397 [Trametopsis cervina]|nr:hypothetical protein BDW22DRAFT_215397 [Trametopsis cervina]
MQQRRLDMEKRREEKIRRLEEEDREMEAEEKRLELLLEQENREAQEKEAAARKAKEDAERLARERQERKEVKRKEQEEARREQQEWNERMEAERLGRERWEREQEEAKRKRQEREEAARKGKSQREGSGSITQSHSGARKTRKEPQHQSRMLEEFFEPVQESQFENAATSTSKTDRLATLTIRERRDAKDAHHEDHSSDNDAEYVPGDSSEEDIPLNPTVRNSAKKAAAYGRGVKPCEACQQQKGGMCDWTGFGQGAVVACRPCRTQRRACVMPGEPKRKRKSAEAQGGSGKRARSGAAEEAGGEEEQIADLKAMMRRLRKITTEAAGVCDALIRRFM